jgi:hypothetical protein
MDLFKNAGGDIANLVTNSKIQHYRRTFLQEHDTILTREDILLALKKFKKHKEVTIIRESSPPFGMYS